MWFIRFAGFSADLCGYWKASALWFMGFIHYSILSGDGVGLGYGKEKKQKKKQGKKIIEIH